MGLSPSFLPRQSCPIKRDQRVLPLMLLVHLYLYQLASETTRGKLLLSTALRVPGHMTAVTLASTRVICFSLLMSVLSKKKLRCTITVLSRESVMI